MAFGGAFNPPTIAHIETANYARKAVGYDEVLFIPSQTHYIEDEQHKDFAFTNEERFSMLESIAKTHEWMKVTDYELTLQEQPRTYTTLKHFENEECHYSLLFGSDKLLELQTVWKHVEDICREFGIVCMARNEDNVEQIIQSDPYLSSLKDYIRIVHTPDTFQNVSSTKARKEFQKALEGQTNSLKEMLPEELHGLKEYIERYRRKSL